MPDRFSVDLNGELWEIEAYGFHLVEVTPLNDKAKDTHWPYNQGADERRGTVSIYECDIYCHSCGIKLQFHKCENKGLRGEYYYCRECIRKYERDPSMCPVCGKKLTTDWDGPYCLNCNRHYYKI